MDDVDNQPDQEAKAEWRAPELQCLSIDIGTEADFTGPASPDGNWGQGAS